MSETGFTSLILAAAGGHLEVVKTLVEKVINMVDFWIATYVIVLGAGRHIHAGMTGGVLPLTLTWFCGGMVDHLHLLFEGVVLAFVYCLLPSLLSVLTFGSSLADTVAVVADRRGPR